MRGSVRALIVVMITALVVTGTSGTAIAAGAASAPDSLDAPASVQEGDDETATATDSGNESAESDDEVNVTLGRQLSTVLTVTSEEVQGEVTNASLTAAFREADETERAELLAARQSELAAQTNATLSTYRSLVSEAGNLTKGEFATRLALINARANRLQASWRRVDRLAEDVSELELDAAGYDASTTDAQESLNVVTGPGANALLRGFTTGDAGNLSLEARNGLAIGVSKGEERAREFEREGDDSTNLAVSQSDALETARGALSSVNGTWQVTSSTVNGDEGVYEFAFRLSGNTTGEAEVTIDGSSGTVIKLEEEIGDDGGPPAGVPGGPPDDRGPPEDRDETDDELTLLVTDGTPTANATVTVAARDGGEPVPNATVRLNDRVVGTTGADGTVVVRLPDGGDAELTATTGDREAELEFELGEEDRTDRLARELNAAGTVTNGTVTLTVTFDGEGVPGVRALVNDRLVGVTGPDGTVSFAADEGPLTVEIRKGQFEATLTFEIDNGTVTTTGTEVSERDERGERDEEPPDDDRDEGDGSGEGPAGDDRSDGDGDGEGPPDDERGESDGGGEGPPNDERGEGEGPPDDERGEDDGNGEGPPDDEETETEEDDDGDETETEDDDETETEGDETLTTFDG